MDCFIHDLSLNRQFANDAAFLEQIEELLRLRQQFPFVHEHLYCSRTLGMASVTATRSFQQVAMASDRNLRQQILQWVSSKGPFWDEQRTHQSEDYFEVAGGRDVTNQGAGEAARRQLLGLAASTFSFPGSGFDVTPLSITHGLPEAPLGQIDLPNFWQAIQLQQGLQAAMPLPKNWAEALAQARSRFPGLILAQPILAVLQPEPFSKYVFERIIELLGVLQAFLDARDASGHYSARNQELIDQHFSGSKAWFTDESVGNQRNFANALTFPDPDNPGQTVFCSWHGKIKSPQYRIHFAPWPLAPEDRQLKVTYIGPKLTKG